jgi:hypothetical protein
LIYRSKSMAWWTTIPSGALLLPLSLSHGQSGDLRTPGPQENVSDQRRRSSSPIATIHWQGVALRDAIGRLEPLFPERIFVDRRIDPDQPISLDIDATSAVHVCDAIAAELDLSVARLGGLIYLGPIAAGDIRGLTLSGSREAARLPVNVRSKLLGKKSLTWPQLTEPRELIQSLAVQNGWQVTNVERIPHDLWAAGELPELPVVNQLTVLLFGFGLTFELQPANRTIAIVDLPSTTLGRANEIAAKPSAESRPRRAPNPRGTKQVYTLRVQEKPVGAVLRELSQRLNWAIDIDEDAIRAAGKSLDQRVSFSVENADREKVLDALLTPAGLEYSMSGEQIRILPKRY